jgi:hypothetical protein
MRLTVDLILIGCSKPPLMYSEAVEGQSAGAGFRRINGVL